MKEVEAVKTKEEIVMVERLLRTHHSDLYGDIWRIGVNLSLRISDLLAIRFDDLDMDIRAIHTRLELGQVLAVDSQLHCGRLRLWQSGNAKDYAAGQLQVRVLCV